MDSFKRFEEQTSERGSSGSLNLQPLHCAFVYGGRPYLVQEAMIDVTTIEDGDNSSAEIENKLLSGPVVREVSEAEIFAGAGSSSSLHPAIPSLVVGDHHLSSRKNNHTPVMNNPGKVLSAMVGLPGGPSSSTTTAPKQSVVPQLMDIYNDLAQSSTPQTTSSLTTATMTHYQQFHHQQQHQQQQQGASSGGGLAAATTNNTTSSVRDSGIGSSSSQASKGSQSKRRRARSGSTSSSTNNRAHRSNNTTATTKSVNTTKIKSENSFEQQGGGAGKQSSTSSRGKKGKVSSADNRWSKRFTWPDEVSRTNLILFFLSLVRIPSHFSLFPSYIYLYLAPSRFRRGYLRRGSQTC